MSNWEKTMKEWDDSVPDGIKYLSAEKQVLMRRVRELESENARLKDAQRWIPVSERLPEDGKPVWVCTIWNEQHSGFLIDGVWVGLFRDFREGEITHWMPLPESPIDQLTAYSVIERQDDKWIPEVK